MKYSYNKYSIGVELTNPLKPNLHSNINTSNNYIGRSIWAYDQQNEPNSLLDGLIDDLKFYDRVLDNQEVVEDMSLIFGGVYFGCSFDIIFGVVKFIFFFGGSSFNLLDCLFCLLCRLISL